jgi:Flp pilus assembly protein TadD
MIRAEQFSRLVQLGGKQWPRFTVLALIGFVVHLPSLQGEMVWDDSFLVRDNPFIKSPLFIFEAFRHYLFLDFYSAHYRPVQNLSFIVDYFFWNTNVYGFHLTNLLLHIGCGLLLYLLLGKLFSSLRDVEADNGNGSAWSLGAFFVALLWIVHPAHSAAVDYISGRADSLAFFFACVGWLLFIRARKSIRPAARTALYSFAALSGLLALCSREIAFVWILLFFLHLTFFDKGLSRRALIITVLCSIGLLGIYAGLHTLPAARLSGAPSQGWPVPMKAVLMLRSLGDYARLMVFPGNLHMERTVMAPENYLSHDQWRHSADIEYLSILGLLFFGALLYGAFRAGPSRGLRIFGASWFLLAYLPISNLIDLNATVAEHWLYLPSVGFLIFVIGCVLDLPVRYRSVMARCACCAAVALSVRSTIRSSDWSTEEIFYRRTLAAGGRSSRILANLGQVYANRGEFAKAEAIYRNVLRLSPDYPIARSNLAEVLLREGHKKEAEELLASTSKATETTRKEYPRTWVAVLNLALSYHREKNDAEALAIAEKARHDYPGVWEIIRFEADVLRQTKGPDSAIPLVEAFARDNWWHYGAAIALGQLYAEKGDVPRAEAELRHASWLDVHDAEALSLIAAISLRQNRFEEAYRAQSRAVARQPDQPRQYVLLSNILEKMGRAGEARDALAEVARLKALGRDASALAN